MYQAIIVIHIILGLGIIGLIMMQQGKGADAGAGFGAGASGSVFGAQGSASFLSRMTAIFATLFFVTSLGLAWLNGHKNAPALDIMGSPEQEVSSDLVLPGNENVNPVVPQTENQVPSIPVEPQASQPQSSATQPISPVSPAPPVSEVRPKPADVPVVEEKGVELKQEAEQKTPKVKKK